VAAPSGRIKVTRYFAVLAVILAGLYALVFFTGNKKPEPKLGLDLKGGTSMTLSAITANDKAPSAQNLDTARQIIENRVNASGVSEPEVVTAGNRNIVVNVANDDPNELRQLVQRRARPRRRAPRPAPPRPAPAAPPRRPALAPTRPPPRSPRPAPRP
jgi:preprotein translocase subunit SecD